MLHYLVFPPDFDHFFTEETGGNEETGSNEETGGNEETGSNEETEGNEETGCSEKPPNTIKKSSRTKRSKRAIGVEVLITIPVIPEDLECLRLGPEQTYIYI